MRESKFQRTLILKLNNLFPGCIVLKNDANQLQGFPDLLVLHGKRWAALECKRRCTSHLQDNQEYYVSLLNDMSFAAFIFPENEEEVLSELQEAFRNRG